MKYTEYNRKIIKELFWSLKIYSDKSSLLNLLKQLHTNPRQVQKSIKDYSPSSKFILYKKEQLNQRDNNETKKIKQ